MESSNYNYDLLEGNESDKSKISKKPGIFIFCME